MNYTKIGLGEIADDRDCACRVDAPVIAEFIDALQLYGAHEKINNTAG